MSRHPLERLQTAIPDLDRRMLAYAYLVCRLSDVVSVETYEGLVDEAIREDQRDR